MRGKRNTGKVMGVRWDRFGWRFERTVWEREDGTRFIVDVALCRTAPDGRESFRHIVSFDGGETWQDGPEALS